MTYLSQSKAARRERAEARRDLADGDRSRRDAAQADGKRTYKPLLPHKQCKHHPDALRGVGRTSRCVECVRVAYQAQKLRRDLGDLY